MRKCKVAILGSGNIGTDLLYKVMRMSELLEVAVLAGIDPDSDGLRRAARLGVATTSGGVQGLVDMPEWQDVEIVFDATSARAHGRNDAACRRDGKRMVDLTPAALGPFCVPVVNGADNKDAPNLNMVTCAGQATIPIVQAVGSVSERIAYAEIVASIASASAGPGTRSNVDEFTRTTSNALELIGGADKGKAIIILNPADPPVLMRNTIYTLSVGGEEAAIEASVEEMAAKVRQYVPGYRLKHRVQFERFGGNRSLEIPGLGTISGLKSTILLEIEGAGHYLPAYAGNLDIMTSAGLRTGEMIARGLMEVAA